MTTAEQIEEELGKMKKDKYNVTGHAIKSYITAWNFIMFTLLFVVILLFVFWFTCEGCWLR